MLLEYFTKFVYKQFITFSYTLQPKNNNTKQCHSYIRKPQMLNDPNLNLKTDKHLR